MGFTRDGQTSHSWKVVIIFSVVLGMNQLINFPARSEYNFNLTGSPLGERQNLYGFEIGDTELGRVFGFDKEDFCKFSDLVFEMEGIFDSIFNIYGIIFSNEGEAGHEVEILGVAKVFVCISEGEDMNFVA